MNYQRPIATSIQTNKLCDYGCQCIAKYRFKSGKVCCSIHFNSCPGKRLDFSNRTDHKARTDKSLNTRKRLGITKSSQIKAGITRKNIGHYKNLASKMRDHWLKKPWNNNPQSPLLNYKNIKLMYQGTFEYKFLEDLEKQYDIQWINDNVKRGPSLWYIDPNDNIKKLYLSDFIIADTIYEIKSSWTWNKLGKDKILEAKNKAKLNECLNQGYKVILVLDNKRIEYAKHFMDGTL